VVTPKQKQASAARRTRNQAHGRKRSYPRVRARPIYTGRSYKVTRRCLERRMFFLADDKADEVENLVGYCLAYAANEFGIQVHACVMMSNHHHTDVTDPSGNLVRFKQLFHSLLARGINVLRGRFDAVWSRDKPCDTRRELEDDALTDLVYTLTNPVKAGLVKWGHQWVGFTTYGMRYGETRTFSRPNFLFAEEGNMPATVQLTLQRPPFYQHLDDDAFYELLMAATRTREQKYHEEFHHFGRRFMGAEKVRRQRWNSAARSFEERFTRVPHVAASSAWSLLAELQRDREWERAYAKARADLLAGREAVFPIGTYWLRHYAGVRVGGLAPP
jgi:hypothetical protein